MEKGKIRYEITFNTLTEHQLYNDFEKVCNERGLKKASAIRMAIRTMIEEWKFFKEIKNQEITK